MHSQANIENQLLFFRQAKNYRQYSTKIKLSICICSINYFCRLFWPGFHLLFGWAFTIITKMKNG